MGKIYVQNQMKRVVRQLSNATLYLSENDPSTCENFPSPEATPIRSVPLNHLMEWSSPQFVISIGHVRVVD